MSSQYSQIVAALYVPKMAAQQFSALHTSLNLSKDHFKDGVFLTFNESRPKGEIIGIYKKQIQAIEKLLTDNYFKDFWEKCSEQQAQAFYDAWHQAFSDWATKPAISMREKKIKIGQAKDRIDKIVEFMKSDPSLQREIGIAVTDAVNGIWRVTRNIGENWESLEILNAQNFLKSLSDRLDMVFDEYAWQSTHNKYPKQIKEAHVERDFFIRRFSPIFFSVYGHNEHEKNFRFLKKLFPHLAFGRNPRDTVRKVLAE